MEDDSKPLVSYEISSEEEIEAIVIRLNWEIRFRKKLPQKWPNSVISDQILTDLNF